MSFQVKRAFRRINRSWLNPSSFIIEFNIEYDYAGPIALLILYALCGFIFMTIRQSLGEENLLNILINGFLNLTEFILTPLIVMAFISFYKVKINFKRDFALISYSFSIRIIFYILNTILLYIFLYFYQNSIIGAAIQIFFIISTTWSLTLQFYYLRADKGIRSFTLLFMIMLSWITVFAAVQIIIYILNTFGLFKIS
ncbi:MAG TPA: hypothetical protein VKU94_02480 [Geobacterales bacterium]|nr:hypothetical protein [Geobacterales bacterium]